MGQEYNTTDMWQILTIVGYHMDVTIYNTI